jgi:hypothetical protein
MSVLTMPLLSLLLSLFILLLTLLLLRTLLLTLVEPLHSAADPAGSGAALTETFCLCVQV